MRRVLLALALSVIAAAPAAAGLEEGLRAYQQRDFKTALQELMLEAQRGNAVAQFHVGRMYDDGNGVVRDYQQAAHWYRKAALQGHAEAQFSYAKLNQWGRGGPKDYKAAATWYKRAANQGYLDAQVSLGNLNAEGGPGLKQNLTEAWKWLDIAANGGDAGAELRREEVGKLLAPAQLAVARQAAVAFKPRPE